MSLPNVHGSAAVLGLRGVLITGISGSGKSTLVAQLISSQQSIGKYARWLSDDQVLIEQYTNGFLMHAPKPIQGKAERAYLGIVETDYLTAARLDLVVKLVAKSELERMPKADLRSPEFDLPLLLLPMVEAPTNVDLVLERLKSL